MKRPGAARERTYTVILQAEPEGGFTAFAPTLRGVVTYGATEDEALDMAREAITLWIEEHEAAGEPVPEEAAPLEARVVSVAA